MSKGHTIINIGRQFGSGGKLIAKRMSDCLGIPAYDNELISKAADESGFSKELFERSDEKRSLFSITSFFGSGRFGSAQNYVGDNEIFKIQSEVIRTSRRKARLSSSADAPTTFSATWSAWMCSSPPHLRTVRKGCPSVWG